MLLLVNGADWSPPGAPPAAIAAPNKGECIVDSPAPLDNTGKVRIESCHQCQWECLTDAQCRGITFDGKLISKAELALLADCGT